MSEERLSSLAILHKYKNVDSDNLVSEFSLGRERCSPFPVATFRVYDTQVQYTLISVTVVAKADK